METATLAGGCFWCLEAVFQRVNGVVEVVSGYSGGSLEDPSYEEVSTGKIGHAEVVQLKFQPDVISFQKILDVFWSIHDPTTLNRQGNDIGPQYRSMILYHNEEQKKTALLSKDVVEKRGDYKHPVVTEIIEFKKFFPADETHKDYYRRNPESGYCRIIIEPKIKKLLKEFKNETRDE